MSWACWRWSIFMPRLTQPDVWLLAAVGGLVALGIVMVFNVSYFRAQEIFGDPYLLFRKHLVAVAVGIVVLTVASRIRPELLERIAPVAFLLCLVALAAVLVPGLGSRRGGAQRWMCAGGFCLQPSEIAKLVVVIYLARTLSRHRDRLHQFAHGFLPPLVSVGLCTALVLLQPDFGTAVILGAVLWCMLFVGGARPLHLAGLTAAGGALLALGIMTSGYRMRRLAAFWDPWSNCQDSAFQLCQSLIAFGSGGIAGVGLGQSRQKMFFLPEAHTDFIFAVIGEELGLFGVVTVLFLFGVIAVRGWRVAARHPDSFSSLLAFGLTLVVVLGAVVNAAVVMGLLPTKGLALPFLSYGGSAMTGALLQIGIIAALSRMTG
jgi:cell division protein FtsW